ncbi:hypothetical protein CRG98_047785 [Punica granatum]|uniref:Uncharacterized protein n=1 Tax=Punica granatum TaxID=22663 RepID=A0A2I0HJG8_PUNGR|nr:hypothetical protein CRG98_047785 [Punica granatum]
MANARLARFVTEVAPPQFVSVMRHRTRKMLDTISEEERDDIVTAGESHSPSPRTSSSSPRSITSASSSASFSVNSKHFLHEVRQYLSFFEN